MTSVFKQVKERYDLRNVMRLEGQKTHGKYNSGICPFHSDNQASCLIYKDGWRCLASSCPKPSGTILDWIAHTRGNDNPTKSEVYKIAKELLGDSEGLIWLPEPTNRTRREEMEVREKPESLTKAAHIYHKMLMESDEATEYLLNRGFSTAAIDWYKFGYNGSAISIPVWERMPDFEVGTGKCIGIRFRNLDGNPKYYGLRGHNEPMLFNQYVVERAIRYNYHKIYVFYGEFDAALANWYDIPAVSPTNGCRAFNPEWLNGYNGDVHFVPDLGEEMQAFHDANSMGLRGYVDEWVYQPAGCSPLKDFTEQLLFWQKCNDGSISHFLDTFTKVSGSHAVTV